MRFRPVAFFAVVALAAACRRAPASDPYWGQVDGIYSQASKVFSSAYANPTPDAVTRLQAYRDQIQALPHPAAANRYHELLVAELDGGLAVLAARRDHDPRGDQLDAKLRDLQRQVDEERRRVAPAARS
jgi:hypothetical protein